MPPAPRLALLLWAHVIMAFPSLNFAALVFFLLVGGRRLAIAGRQLCIQTYISEWAEKKLKQVSSRGLSEQQDELSTSQHDPRGCLDERSLLR